MASLIFQAAKGASYPSRYRCSCLRTGLKYFKTVQRRLKVAAQTSEGNKKKYCIRHFSLSLPSNAKRALEVSEETSSHGFGIVFARPLHAVAGLPDLSKRKQEKVDAGWMLFCTDFIAGR